MKTPIAILGPTGVGKTELCLGLAEWLGCPIINCDSRQLYRQLQIGTASPTPQQLARVRHYMVGTLDVGDYYSAARYEADALQLISQLHARSDVALLAGGSMMYMDAVCHGLGDIPTVPDDLRQTVRQRLDAEGLDSLYSELCVRDPDYAAEVDRHNTRRVVHALEICLLTGRHYSALRTGTAAPRPFRVVKVGLARPREELFARINRRVDEMMTHGLMDEARVMYQHREQNALNTVGYKELFRVLDGEWELPMAVERIKKNTRVYAKKQMTWFARDVAVRWFHPDDASGIKDYISQRLASD